jgi:NAD(P)-dependent dehydrogenase (short-subunit alcohol dehydrogenase family)
VPTVLITGASTGIGRATALRMAGAGWRVLAGVREESVGEQLRGEGAAAIAAGTGGDISPLLLDVTEPEQIERAASEMGEPAGLDGLVNNAGIGVGGPLEIVSDEELKLQFEVNVFGALAVTRALLPALRARRGRIVFVSSVGGRVAVPYNGPYAASKHAIEAFGDALRGELHDAGIAVSLIEPGSVKTPIWGKAREVAAQVQVPEHLDEHYGHVPQAFTKVLADTERRGIPPERVAAAIEHALTARRPRARYLLGRDARGMVLAHGLLPTSAFDALVRRALALSRG